MQKFIYLLNDSPTYPNEIMAKDKAEVMKLVCESVSKESILGIYTEDEFLIKSGMKPMPQHMQVPPTKDAEPVDNDNSVDNIEEADYANGNDFMNDMMNKALQKARNNEKLVKQNSSTPTQVPKDQAPASPAISSEPKYFEDHGTKFKMENGKIYKKVWVDISSDENSEYRIIKKTTGKVVSGKDLVLEKLDWQELA